MRMIDADALLDDVKSHCETYFADDFAREWVDKQPTVDAVPVIRCKDCEFLTSTMKCSVHYDDWGSYLDTSLNSYCSDAERKEE